MWRFKEDVLKENDRIRKNKRIREVLQYNLNGDFVKEWKAISDVGKTLKFSIPHISDVCKGKRKTSNGFIWKYKIEQEFE